MQSQGEIEGKLFVVGIGPGASDLLTPRAERAIENSEYVVGNSIYLDQIRHLLHGKRVFESSMGREVERARHAIALAREHTVSIVSGGDPGVYGMAGIVLELLERSGECIPFEVVPGVTAATAAAALVGAPLVGDFAVISLSDLLTPFERIEERLHAAFSVRIPVVLYNPRSRTRTGQLARAIEIASSYLPGKTPVACVWNASRAGEAVRLTTLREFGGVEELVDMHTTVIVGGEGSRLWRSKDHEWIITRRGYDRKYEY